MACARRVNASTMVSAILSNSGSSTRASAPAISYCMVNSMLQASAESGLKCHAAAKCRNGPFTSLSSIDSPVRFSFCVVKDWRSPRLPMIIVARTPAAVRSSTFAAVHQGRKRG